MTTKVIGDSGTEYEVEGIGYHLAPNGTIDPYYCEGFYITKKKSIVHFHLVKEPRLPYCPRCGQMQYIGSAYCGWCGTKLRSHQPTQPEKRQECKL
jgi:tRNA(Ile2) C34 agmatinyltransferase TiaS